MHDRTEPIQNLLCRKMKIHVAVIDEEPVDSLFQQRRDQTSNQESLPAAVGNIDPELFVPVFVFSQSKIPVFRIILTKVFDGAHIDIAVDLVSGSPKCIDLLFGKVLCVNDHRFEAFQRIEIFRYAEEHPIV